MNRRLTLTWITRHILSGARGYASGGGKGKDLKSVLKSKIPKEQERIKRFRKEFGNTKVDEVTVNKVYGGMRGMKGLICETSVLDPQEGIRFRGLSIPECIEQLPKCPKGGEQPLPEAIFFLLVSGEVPSQEQCNALSKEWAERSCLPDHVEQFLDTVPPDVHPMSQFAAAVTICNTESKFMEAVQKTQAKKSEYWDSTFEDAMDICAKITPIAAKIYRNSFKDRQLPPIDPSKDWSENFSLMMGYDCHEFFELMRLYLVLHCDHEGGNVSAHATHLVGSALSDPYLAFAAGMNGLAGPLHGLANQEVLNFLENQKKEIGDSPTEDKVKAFVEKTVKKTVIPGYGHAVLRKTDPRFVYFKKFGDKFFPDDPLVKLVDVNFKVIPPVLKALGKVQNPWPNVDAGSGVLLQHYGMNEKTFYTVLFGVSRALGVLASLIWDRALGFPIERPKSISTNDFIKLVCSQNKKKK